MEPQMLRLSRFDGGVLRGAIVLVQAHLQPGRDLSSDHVHVFEEISVVALGQTRAVQPYRRHVQGCGQPRRGVLVASNRCQESIVKGNDDWVRIQSLD